MDIIPLVVNVVVISLALLKLYTQLKADIGSVFQSAVLRGKRTLVKIVHQAKVAQIALLLTEFVKLDLIDGEPAELIALEEFLREHIKESRMHHPIHSTK